MTKAPRAVSLLALLALLLAACGQLEGPDLADDTTTPEPTVTVTVTETVSPEPVTDDEPADPCDDPPAETDLIFVTSPTVGQAVTSPFTVSGCSSTFEASVIWELYDADGQLLAEHHTMGGTFGEIEPFSFEVAYSVTDEQVGSLKVYETSAKDGSDLHVNTIPLILQP
jgi:hypothetical protein